MDEPVVDRIAKLCAAAASGTCTCAGKWIPAAERMMEVQGLNSQHFRSLVLRALRDGRRKGHNVLIVGAPDGGKSFAFKPLPLIFETFINSEADNYPLQGIHGKEIAVLQDARYESFGLHWDGWLRWGEGEAVKVKLPRSFYKESVIYTGTAPLFASMASPFSFPLAEARKTGRDVEYENGQFRSRWVVVNYRTAIPADERDSMLDPCQRCGARWYAGVCNLAELAAAGLMAGPGAVAVAASVLADSSQDDVTDSKLLVVVPASATRATQLPIKDQPTKRPRLDDASQNCRFEKLRSLMEWRQSGLVDSPEFKMAKRELLGMQDN